VFDHWQILPGGSPLDSSTKVGAIVTDMRKRKGVKVEVPGVENVSFAPRVMYRRIDLLTPCDSTTTSCKRLSNTPMEGRRMPQWAHDINRLVTKIRDVCPSPWRSSLLSSGGAC
jgi:hypothetical protein